MSKQVWGTFAVRDHCEPNAFVGEVMLYDRLVIPIPPDAGEQARWENAGWRPDALNDLLAILGDRAYTVPWDSNRKQRWKERYDGGLEIARGTDDWAFVATRSELTSGLPRHVTGIQAVPHYGSLSDLESELQLTSATQDQIPLHGGAAIAILGHEFLVPDDPKWKHEDLLREAVELSSETAFRRKRASFWRWQREFLDDKGITDQGAIQEAVEEMRDLLEEERALTRRKQIHTGVQYSFLISSVVLGMLGGPLTAVGIGGAFVSVGQFVSDRLLADEGDEMPRPAAMLRDIQKHFGW